MESILSEQTQSIYLNATIQVSKNITPDTRHITPNQTQMFDLNMLNQQITQDENQK